MAAFHSISQLSSTNEVFFPNLKSDLLPTNKEVSWSFLELTSRQPANVRTGDAHHIDTKEAINSRRFHTQNTQLSESYLNSEKQKVQTCKSSPVNPACASYSKHEIRKDRRKTLSDSFPQDNLFEVAKPIQSIPLTALEIEAVKRAEENTKRRLSRKPQHSNTKLDIDWVLEQTTTEEVISQSKDSSALVNVGQTPRRRESKNTASLLERETLAEDSLSLNEVELLFQNCTLKEEETQKNTTDEQQSDLSPRSRRIAVCDRTDTACFERKKARINLKRFGLLDCGMQN